MKIQLLSLSLLFSPALWSQYYYNDIIGTEENNRQMQNYVAAKVKTVSATGYDQNGVRSTDYSEFQEVKEGGRLLKVTKINNLNKSVVYSQFDENIRLVRVTDTVSGIENSTTYEYDKDGRVSKIQNSVKDASGDFSQVETHVWKYNSNGKPELMWRMVTNTGVMSGSDTLEIRFIPDENGNVSEERTFKRKVETHFVYYYYDEINRLTDIVEFNKKIKKLVPSVIFTYDDTNRVIQKITSTPGERFGKVTWIGYTIWRYLYDANGLKKKEALFDKNQDPAGKIEYAYTFGP